MVTGSHNPPDYNGLKMVVAGDTLSGDDIQALRTRIEDGALARRAAAPIAQHDIGPAYLERIVGDVKLARPLKIAVDCGNGVAGAFAPDAVPRAGLRRRAELFCEVDGHFPNHHPDPSQPENLRDLIARLRKGDCELGLAFDGDGDRLGVVTRDGHIIYPDRQLMLFAADVLTRKPGATIIYDVKSTRNLKPWIRAHGGVPLLWKTGHSLIKAQDEGNRRGAGRRDERPHVLQGALVRLRRRPLRRARACWRSCRAHADPSAVLDALPDAFRRPSSTCRAPKASRTR